VFPYSPHYVQDELLNTPLTLLYSLTLPNLASSIPMQEATRRASHFDSPISK
jgi:hypothetical protein